MDAKMSDLLREQTAQAAECARSEGTVGKAVLTVPVAMAMSYRDRMEPAPGTAGYSFCETIFAGGATPWHIRKLTSAGPKYSGGADSNALCGRTMEFGGWDINVPITEHHLKRACAQCVQALRESKP